MYLKAVYGEKQGYSDVGQLVPGHSGSSNETANQLVNAGSETELILELAVDVPY